MEDVDKIIIHNLRQIGCDIDDGVKNIKQFDANMVVNATVRCLDVINPGLHLPHSLPPNMASKYRVGQQIAQACMELGYRADIGYQTFLYSGESDIRKILMYLVERLPKEEEKPLREATGTELLMKRIKCKVKDELERPWLPFNVDYEDVSHQFLSESDPHMMPTQAWRRFWKEDLFSGAIEPKHLLPTLVTLHSRGVLARYEPHWFISKKPTTLQEEKFSTEPVISKPKPALPPKPKIRDQQTSVVADSKNVEILEQERIALEIEELEAQVAQLKLRRHQTNEDISLEKHTLDDERKKNVLKAKTIELLPDAEANLAKLQSAIEFRTNKLVNLAKQWESHRLPLINKYRECVEANSSRENESAKNAESARSLGERRRELESELKSKEQLLSQLQAENERLGKEAHRAAYTRRILEIIGNVDKQKVEIAKVLKDTQDVQKEINTLSGQLDRCFTLADETIFADAKKNEASKQAYKLLATLHSDCGQIVDMIQATGATQREIRDLEDQIEKERSKDVGGNLARIAADLSQMQQESEALSTQLSLRAQNKSNPMEPS